ncbi:MAG: fused MFS/spermidine synthase, partial [Alphaproteobacteria bacterium]
MFLGITTYAHTAVVCAFLLGLALGARLLGVRADRHERPLRLYAWLEAGIGLYAAATPWVFPRLLDYYATLAGPAGLVGAGAHAPRFLVAMGAMLLPAMLMGGTLPTLVRAVASIQPSFSAVVGRIYGVNTLGAAAGAFATGFLLLPALGVRTTILVAAATNLIIAATVLAIESGSRKGEQKPKKIEKRMADASEVSLPRATRAALIAGFAASGFAALVLELAWIRSLILVVGSSVYAFSATLATYLAGLGAGSLLVVRLLRNASHKVRMRWAAWLEAAVGWSALLGIAVIAFLPEAFLAGYRA